MSSEQMLFAVGMGLFIMALLGIRTRYVQYLDLHFSPNSESKKPQFAFIRLFPAWFWKQWLPEFSTEAFGAAIGIIIVSIFINQIQEQEQNDRLLRLMGSRSNIVAITALEEMRSLDLLNGDFLRDANLANANLASADLQDTNLIGVDLEVANLSQANLGYAHLTNANLANATLEDTIFWFADLENTSFMVADLENAYLVNSNLAGADFWNANLTGADLEDANLEGANLDGARFNDRTILPDGTTWNTATDMTMFTDPTHPNFWRSINPDSPAYRGYG